MAQELSIPSLTETDIAADVTAPEPPKPETLTAKQIGQLRRQYITVVHGTVTACGHKAKFSRNNMRDAKVPNNNCASCWEAFFMTSVDLEGIHTILTKSGASELVKQKGLKFVKMFSGFLAAKLLPALNAIEAPVEAPIQIEGSTIDAQATGA